MSNDEQIFQPAIRDRAIETTCANLLISGVLLPEEISRYMSQITSLNDYELAEQLCASRLLLDNYYEALPINRRN